MDLEITIELCVSSVCLKYMKYGSHASYDVRVIRIHVFSCSSIGKIAGKYDIIPLRDRGKLIVSPDFSSIPTMEYIDSLLRFMGT